MTFRQATRSTFLRFCDFSITLNMSGGYGKIPKPSKSWPGGLSKRQRFGVIFSEFGYFFSQKSGKIQKKNSKNSKKKMNLVLCIVWYIFFFRFYCWRFNVQKNIFLNFAQFLKSPWDSGTPRVWVYREKFNIDFLAQNFFLASIHV